MTDTTQDITLTPIQQAAFQDLAERRAANDNTLNTALNLAMGSHRETMLALNREAQVVLDQLVAASVPGFTSTEQLLAAGRDIVIERDHASGSFTCRVVAVPDAAANAPVLN